MPPNRNSGRYLMAFDPLQEHGIPLEKQLRNWSELNVTPVKKIKQVREAF